MQIEDLKVISELIHKYGLKKIEKVLEKDKEFLEYMHGKSKVPYNSTKKDSLYYEDSNKQIFTNSETSVFCLNTKLLDFELLESDTLMKPPSSFVEENEINKYIDKCLNLFGRYKSEVRLITRDGTIVSSESLIPSNRISINEKKLIELLLEKPKLYVSTKYPILYAESEKGYAYVLGERNGRQSLLK